VKSYSQSTDGVIPAGITTGEYLSRAVKEVGGKAAIIFEDKQITYSELASQVDTIAASLLRLGVGYSDRVGILMPNYPEYIYASQAIMKIGAVKVLLHINFRELEIKNTLKHSGAKAVFVVSAFGGFSFAEYIHSLREELPDLKYVIVLKGEALPGMIPYRQIIEDNPKAQEAVENYVNQQQVEADDVAAIVYTSGTTGTPKGILHTHNNICRLAYASNARRKVTEDDIWLNMLPLSSAFGLQYGEPCPLISKGTLVLTDSFNEVNALELIEKYKVTSPVGVPTQFIRMLKNPRFGEFNVSSVRNAYLGGAAVPADMMIDIKEKFGCSVVQTYGTSETGHATQHYLDEDIETICGTSGYPTYGGTEVKIVGANGKIVDVGQVGEIYMRHSATARGYYLDPERTKDAFDDWGWVHVGDLGVMDEQGYITVIGRLKELIVRGGFNIYPDEIESLLYTHEKIAQVSVVGYPDPELTERSCAFIILKAGCEDVTREELVAFMEKKVARYKIPDRVIVVNSFPMTASGKVQKHKLRELITGCVQNESGGA